mgnify:CR=1 FL=1
MQRKKRTKSKLVKQFMNFLLAIALGIELVYYNCRSYQKR